MAKSNKASPKVSVAKKEAGNRKKKPAARASKKGGPPAATRIMEAIASQIAMGTDKPSRGVIQGLAAMESVKSFNTTILNMKNKGLVMYDQTTVWLTEQGLEAVGPEAIAKPQNNDAMQDKMKENISSKRSREIFDILTDGRAYTRAELAEKMGLENNKSFGTYLSSLSKVVERINGKIRLIDLAFPCGRPCDS